MLKAIIVAIGVALVGSPAAAGAPIRSEAVRTAAARDLADFDWVTAAIARNYSGFETKTAGRRAVEHAQVLRRTRAELVARHGGRDALRRALGIYVAWFDDGHLGIGWTAPSVDVPWPRHRRAPPRASATPARLGATALTSPVGRWTINDRYLVEVRPARSRLEAVVVATTAPGWAPGDVKAVLTPDTAGGWRMRYGASDRTEVLESARLRARGTIVDVGELGVWRRVLADEDRPLAAELWPSDAFPLTRLDATTLYLRMPSFGPQHAASVRALIERERDALATTPNLIIDVRHNGGGSDFVYSPVLPYVLSRPIVRVGVEIRVSADNARLRAAAADAIAEASPEGAAMLRAESTRMATATTAFIRREPPLEIVPLAAASPRPQRVAVLIDGAGSAAESFLLDVRQSRKVTLFGQTNSAGVLDFGEMMSAPAPSGRLQLRWATTRSLRLPHDPLDPDGMTPDVIIPPDEAPISFVRRWVSGSSRSD